MQWDTDEPFALAEGNAGWTIDRPILRLPDGTTLTLRLTLVWHLEDGIWRIVHSHASIGG
jgi:hypothetical protein